jgi:two-component system, NarL family, uhpT operon response regulator UhpA
MSDGEAGPDPGRGGIRIGLVDDHVMFLDGMRRCLAEHSAELQVAVVATSWTEFVTDPSFPVDVVVLDLDLRDGIPPHVKIANARAAGCEVVVVSGFAESRHVRSALAAGALGYVPKADSTEEVYQSIAAAARGERYLTPALATLLLDTPDLAPDLSRQELRALTLYASGLPLKSVARQLGVGYESAKSYLDRVREKYSQVGRGARTKLELRDRAIEDGLILDHDGRTDGR